MSLAAGHWLASLLYGVKAHDPFTLGSVIAGLLLIACVAISIPAWRAVRADVLTTLRYE